MKHTAYYPFFHLFNYSIKAYKKYSFLYLIGVLLLASNFAHAQLPQFDDFESGFGNWNDGGNRCDRTNNGDTIDGNWSIQLRDNSGVASSMTTNPIDLTTYNSVTIEFLFKVVSFESGEDFFVEYNDGSGFVPIANYTVNVNFLNNVTYIVSLTLNSPLFNLSNNARFRIRADASGNADFLYIDNVNISSTCQISTADGTTSLACPSVESGGLGLSGADVTFNCYEDDTTLEASYLDLGETTSYVVEGIPYSPPFQFNCLANAVSVNNDDVFSPVIDLPFDFCFYGNTYDSCVIGSNGVISFDSSLANSQTGWRILTQIPSSINSSDFQGPGNRRRDYFFGPSIYGVHHDIDPTAGGEIGYQLITLNTGCRALVAAWSDVPMYGDNSKLYTGMIVFYEDTNVIEVYTKEKRVNASWNNGRAAIGLQANSTVGITAPNRNSFDTPWNVTNEAWRFTPNGASITELKWYENSVSAANEIIDPDNDGQITVSPTSTTTYIAEVTYNLCNGNLLVETDETLVTVVGKKIWNGSQSKTWTNPNNWTPVGVPLPSDCIVIPNTSSDPIISSTTDATGYNLEIKDGSVVTQQPNTTLTIEDRIVISPNGSLEVQDDASVIQITDVLTNQNIGAAKVQRQATDVENYDYVYWSAPVENFAVELISPGTPASVIYEWIPTTNNGTLGNHGNWVNSSGNMIPGKGYIVRGLLGTTIANTAEFQGRLNNGRISFPIYRGTYTGASYSGIGNTSTADDDNWNLLGNPYPSAISLVDFVAANPAIDGTLYFWRHLNALDSGISIPFYGNYTYNYDSNDYIAANALGSSPPGFNDYIASGQGFFARMLDSAPTPNNVTFSNTMRNSTYQNDGFYRSATIDGQEKHRIWLDMVRNGNTAISILVGFADGATNDIDRLFDGVSINDSENQFYSLVSDKTLTIQGKALPFDDSETFTLGYKVPTSGSFTISINQLDGLFADSSQDIYLEDTELDIIHNLRANPYAFTTDEGTFNNRFILRFSPETLSTTDREIPSDLIIRSINKTIDASSTLSTIKTFELFDVTGRVIHKNLRVNNTNYNYQTNNLSSGTYVVKVSLDNGAVVTKKLIL